MKQLRLKYIFCLVTMGILLFLIIKDAQKKIADRVDWALRECIVDDYHQRLEKVAHSVAEPTPGKVKTVDIYTKEGPVTYTFADSMEAGVAARLGTQSVLARINPLVPDSFNVLLRKKLQLFDISGESGVVYSFLQHHQYSNQDSVTAKSATYRSELVVLDVLEEASVQVWVNYEGKTLVSYCLGRGWLAVAFLILCFIGWQWNRFRRKKLVESRVQAEAIGQKLVAGYTPVEVKTVSESSLSVQADVPDGLYISPMRELYVNRELVTISFMPLRILERLIENREKGKLTSREEIRLLCWPDEQGKMVYRRTNTHISELRKLLENSEYEIVAVWKEGFKLQTKKKVVSRNGDGK